MESGLPEVTGSISPRVATAIECKFNATLWLQNRIVRYTSLASHVMNSGRGAHDPAGLSSGRERRSGWCQAEFALNRLV